MVSKANKEVMWQKGILGEDDPGQLSDTMLYLISINCVLQGGDEHKHLWHPGFNSHLQVGVDTEGDKCLIFTEDPKCKTNQGGLDC